MTIHWCGAGPIAVPGLRRLIIAGHDVQVWTRSLDRAEDAVGDLTQRLHELEPDALASDLAPDDVLVSLLPDDHHSALAELALSRGAHFICASELTPGLRSLHARTQIKGVCLVGEVGLAPGIDHLMAHALVADYRASATYDPANTLSFSSWCGILPHTSNAFRHKFSGPALPELARLRQPARSIRTFVPLTLQRPWEGVMRFDAPLPHPETFQVYPSGDSLQCLDAYAFDPTWKVRDFARGTLRLNGWCDAWRDVLDQIAAIPAGACRDTALNALAARLEHDHSFALGEPDRVVLCVTLLAETAGQTIWHRTYTLDAHGDARGAAQSRLTSVPVSCAVDAVMAHQIAPGVSSAPSDARLVLRWLELLTAECQYLNKVNHLG